MKNFIYTLLISVAFAFAADYSDFEKSLMGESETHQVESIQDESSLVDSSTSADDFERSLISVPSEMEPVYSIRQDLLENVKKQNKQNVIKLAEQLKSMETRDLIPYHSVELQYIYIELGLYDQLETELIHYYKTVLDTERFSQNPALATNDGLFLYVVNTLRNQDTTKTLYAANKSRIEHANISDKTRRKLEVLMRLRNAYRDESEGKWVCTKAKSYVEDYPDDPDSPWMKKAIVGPLSRMDVFDFKMSKRDEQKEDVIKGKLYTGGLGFNIFFAMGGFGVGFDGLYRNDLYEPDPMPVNFEFYTQFSNISVSFELINTGLTGMTSLGLGIGWVAYDSRYLKIRPYMGYSAAFMNVTYGQDYIHGDYIIPAGEPETSETNGFRLVAATNVDFKFATPFLLFSSSKLISLALVGKFGVSYIDIDNELAKGSGFDGFFNLGFGIYFW